MSAGDASDSRRQRQQQEFAMRPTCAAFILVFSASVAPPLEAAVEPSTDAIWRVQQMDFRLRTGARYHSCSGLQTKILAILDAIGAGKAVVTLNCTAELTNNVSARVATATPIAATTANVAAATTHDTRTELVARLQQATLPTANDIEVFPAEWRTVSVTSIRGIRLNAGDCELLQGLSEQILPYLEVRIVRKRFACGATARPVLVVEALMRRAA
jgi:hypothetical protein